MADTRIYKHPKRPEWGMAMVHDWVEDRVRFLFEDAQIRAFKVETMDVFEVVHMPEDEAATLRAKMQRSERAARPRVAKPGSKSRVPRA